MPMSEPVCTYHCGPTDLIILALKSLELCYMESYIHIKKLTWKPVSKIAENIPKLTLISAYKKLLSG